MLMVLSSDPQMRNALCAEATSLGLEVEPAASIADVEQRLVRPPVVVLVEAVRSVALARAFIARADTLGVRAGVICNHETEDLACHASVCHMLATPFTAASLRTFLADVARIRRPHESQQRLRAIASVPPPPPRRSRAAS